LQPGKDDIKFFDSQRMIIIGLLPLLDQLKVFEVVGKNLEPFGLIETKEP
jgi:hypothetical protein